MKENIKLIRYATRGSELALTQARKAIEALTSEGIVCEEVIIKTTGDRVKDIPLFKVGGQGLFIKEVEDAVLNGEAEVAVHSMKDLPGELHPELTLLAAGLPEDPRDCFVSDKYKSLSEMPPGSLLGTSSLRRRALISRRFPHIKFTDMRGNLDTRISKMRSGESDGIIVAAAGIKRLGREEEICEYLKPEEFIPAACQGLIAIECKKSDEAALKHLFAKFAVSEAMLRANTERAFLRELQGGCKTPMGVYAAIKGDLIKVFAFAASQDFKKYEFFEGEGSTQDCETLGRKAAIAVKKALV